MTPRLSSEHLAALRELGSLWPRTPLAVTGATAIALRHPDFWRQTADVDLIVAASVTTLRDDLRSLSGWRRHPQLEHQWFSPGGARLDIVPASPDLLAAGEVIWPESGARMSLLGLRLVFEGRHELVLEEGLSLQVAPLHVVALLKVVSYLDRPAERERDLEDLGHLLERYVDPIDPRCFDEEIFEAGLSLEQAPAFLLGRDLRGAVGPTEANVLRRFLERARDERDPHGTQARMARLGPVGWRRQVSELMLRLVALEEGLRWPRRAP